MEASGGAAAQGARVGELFSYEARDPVSIPRGQAALVPIVSRRIAGRRVLVYQASFSPRPVNAWVLANDTDLTFEAGAVTFFEGSTSLGEGILGHTLPPGGQEVVPYAVDASVDVTPKIASRQEPYIRGNLVAGKSAQQRLIAEAQQQMQRLAEEEERLRRNIGSVGYNQPKEAELRARWMTALAGAEEQLTGLRGRVDEAGAKVRALEEQIAAKMRGYRED